MDFGKQFKELRLENALTQQQIADKLNVSRQAISNWENNKNLPDLIMVINISKVFNCSLDKLILGGNNMTEKLIKDGSENRRAKMNLISITIGAVLLLIGAAFILLKGFSVEYIDESGILHENFFLLPIGFLFIFSGFITFVVVGIKKVSNKIVLKSK